MNKPYLLPSGSLLLRELAACEFMPLPLFFSSKHGQFIENS